MDEAPVPASSPSLADLAPVVLRCAFNEAPNTFLTQHHISTYESFVFREMADIIHAENPITVLKEPLDVEGGIYRYKTEIFIGGNVPTANELAISVGPPVITLDDGETVRRMFPNEARIRNLSYSANFQADILVRVTLTTPVAEAATAVMTGGAAARPVATTTGFTTKILERRFDKFSLFNIPILLRSKLCATHGADTDLLHEMGECRNDQGGYFIIEGAEKLLITRQEQAFNSVYVAEKSESDPKLKTYASVICQHPTTKLTRRVALYRLRGNRNTPDDVIRVSLPFVKGAVPLFIVFRALGVESDGDILRMILPDVAAPITAAMETTLRACVEDARPCLTRPQALEFIRTLTKGFVMADVLNILSTHLFSHVPERPLARAQYLAEIVRKMIRVEMGAESPTSRDDIRNQRLLPAGTLLRGLFTDCWKLWKKAVRGAIESLYLYNKTLYQGEDFMLIFSPGNIGNILMPSTKIDGKPATLNDSIMRGFRGKWGTNQYNTKVGVIQPMARLSYLDSMSHTRRVVSDFDTSMKLTGPRHLHTSQVGYFCTAETPTGAHIGATKNLSILTAVSIAAPADPVMNWLFSRGGVIEVSAATEALRATATSVQINGGTIGFTTNPGLLTRVLKMMKWTACLAPSASVSFNTGDNVVRIYLDDGRPLRPLYHLDGGAAPAALIASIEAGAKPRWRDMVCGTLAATAAFAFTSVAFVDPLATNPVATLTDYEAILKDFVGSVEYIDPYEGNEAYISWWGRVDNLSRDHTHVEIHPSSLMGLLANMIPFANHNQSPRNQLSCSQSKQGIAYYATNFENRFDTYGSMLCYGEGALCRTIVHDAVGGGNMPYGTNLIFALCSFNGYNQDDGILFNRSSIERGMFRSLALRSYELVEMEDNMTHAVYKIGNPRNVLAWTDLKPGYDYSALDENGIIKEGTVIHDRTVLAACYLTNSETREISDASLVPTVFTKGRVDKVVMLHQANGMRLVRVRILEERVPELGDKFCLTPDHDVLTANRGWVSIAEVTGDDDVYCLNPKDNSIVYSKPSRTYKFDCFNEDLYQLKSQQVDLTTTMNHKMWVQPRNKNMYELIEAKEIHGKRVRYMKDGANKNSDYEFKLPECDDKISMDAWLEFLGLWISDGWVTESAPRRGRTEGEMRIEICAVVKQHRAQILAVCDKLGFHVVIPKGDTKLFINKKPYAKYLKSFSVGAINKRLPDWVWSLSERQCRILLEGLVSGDGYKSKKGVLGFYTSSIGLRDDVQRLCLHAGYSANVFLRGKAGTVFRIRGKMVKTNADSWAVGIVRSKNQPTINHGHSKTQCGQSEEIIKYTGSVYCLEVPTHIFYVRHNGKPVWTGNSSRHGQKGTMGMLLDAVDMPRTADGMVPDVIVNPHCIPSRMTIAQMLEQVFGKLGAMMGAKINATTFMNDESSYATIANALESLGVHRDGEEILYSGMTGRMFTCSVFMAPLYYMRLKHLTQDKMNARSAGRREIRTHQPTGGRGNEGGMRIGEMERDSLIAHGITDFLQESMMRRSDGTSFYVCNGCGTIPIYNEAQGLFVCALCDGPLTFQGDTTSNLALVLPVKKSRTTFSKVSMPYALKLLDQEITTYMNAGMRILTEGGARHFREPNELDLDDLLEMQKVKDAAEAVEVEEETMGGLNAAIDATRAAIDKVSALDVLPGADGGAEDAVADNEEEGQPARNEVGAAPETGAVGAALEGDAGQPAVPAVIEFSAKTPQYKEFGNYFSVKLMIDGKMYPTVEHYYQAMKFSDHPEYQESIRIAKTPAVAKKLGKTTEIASRKDWPAYKDTVMKKALMEKFSPNHPELRKKLLETGNAMLRDGSPMDNYWGIGRSKKGRNRLGQLLMEVRDELRRAETAATRAAVGGGGAAGGLGIDALLTRPSVDASNAAAVTTNGGAAPSVVIQIGAEAAQPQVQPQPQQGPLLVPDVEEEPVEEAPAPAPAPANPNPPQMKIMDLTAATAQPLPAVEVAPIIAPEYKTVFFKPGEMVKN